MKILGFCGSLRKESYNMKLLHSFKSILPANTSFSVAEIGDFPLFSEDLEKAAFPEAALRVADQVAKADALIFACPEYNYSVSGVLKNAIDWVSRHPNRPFTKKVCGIMGASIGRLGTARAQYHLRQIGVFLDVRFLNRPEIMVGEASKKFDDKGQLVDESAISLLKKMADELSDAVNKK